MISRLAEEAVNTPKVELADLRTKAYALGTELGIREKRLIDVIKLLRDLKFQIDELGAPASYINIQFLDGAEAVGMRTNRMTKMAVKASDQLYHEGNVS